MILKSISSFGALVLNNGTTHRSRVMMNVTPTGNANAMTLPNGIVYDPYEGDDIVVQPGKVNYDLFLNCASQSVCLAAVEAIVAFVGKKETITAVDLSDSTVTASGRLESIQDMSPISFGPHQRRLRLAFQSYEVFS